MPLETELSLVKSAVRQAGEAILRIAQEDFETDQKNDRSFVTAADLEANRILKNLLTVEFPDYGWLSEETSDDHKRLGQGRVWIVDPVDGTREFVKKIPEFAVSVALVEQNKVVLGVVYNPSTGELFEAVRNGGAKLNGHAIMSDHSLGAKPIVEASRSDLKKGRFESLEALMEIHPCGSIAYKLARVAAGRADAVLSLTPKNEWDIAAGVLLVEEAGGKARRCSGEPFVFNQPQTLVDGIIAASAAAYDTIREIVRQQEKIETVQIETCDKPIDVEI
jgi:myo-inositol-1(or 4)-monophosphatase